MGFAKFAYFVLKVTYKKKKQKKNGLSDQIRLKMTVYYLFSLLFFSKLLILFWFFFLFFISNRFVDNFWKLFLPVTVFLSTSTFSQTGKISFIVNQTIHFKS